MTQLALAYPKVGTVLTFLPYCSSSGQILMVFKIYLKIFFSIDKAMCQKVRVFSAFFQLFQESPVVKFIKFSNIPKEKVLVILKNVWNQMLQPNKVHWSDISRKREASGE